MTFTDSGKISTRALVIQLVILAVVAVVFAFVKIYSPRMEKAQAAAQLAERESSIQDFFNTMVAEDYGSVVQTGRGKIHPQRLESTPSMGDVQQALGAADTSTTDFAGGLHLSWIGTAHTLVASFNHGELYALTFKNNSTGHGVNVYKSSVQWQEF